MAKITGTGGDDRLGGTSAADILIGAGGDDVLIGRGGDDRLFGGNGRDTFYGGAGDDLIRPGSNDGTDLVFASIGNDTIDFRDSLPAAGYASFEIDYRVLPGGIEASIGKRGGTIAKGIDGSTDRLVNIQDSPDNWGLSIVGTPDDDVVRMNVAQDQFMQFQAKGGSDRVFGGDGFDRLAYTTELTGGGIDVRITGYDGGAMNGTVTEDTGARDVFRRIDEVQGSRLDDIFRGGAGDDRFIGDAGDDRILGGDGFDLARYDRSGLDGILADLRAGEVMEEWTSGYGRIGSWIDQLRGIEWIRGSNGDDRFFGDGAANRFEGRDGDDQARGGAGDDRLEGEGGDDRLFGEDGEDWLEAGAGSNRLDGGAGDDTLFSEGGSNILIGGSGGDQFRFAQAAGTHVIRDFADGVDHLRFDGAARLADIGRARDGSDSILTFGDQTVRVLGVLPGDLGPDDFLFA